MVVFMLLLLLLQATSGLFMTDDIFTNGPYYDSVNKDIQKIMSLIHNNVFDIIIVVSTLHVAAITYYLIVKKQNLISAMFTGKKWVENKYVTSAISHSKLILALILLIIVCAFIYWLVVLNIPEVEEFYY